MFSAYPYLLLNVFLDWSVVKLLSTSDPNENVPTRDIEILMQKYTIIAESIEENAML